MMKNLRVVIIIVIIAVIVIFIGSAVRSYYIFLKEPVSPVTDALPANTSLLIRTKSVYSLFESVNNSALVDLFDRKNSGYFDISRFLDTIKQENNKLYELLQSGETVFAFVPDVNNKNRLFVAVSIGKSGLGNLNTRISELVVSQGYQVFKTDKGYYRIANPVNSVWYYINKGVFAISGDSSVLMNSYNTLESGKTLSTEKEFSKLLSTTGKSVDASILINNQILANTIWPTKAALVSEGTPFNGWSSLDLSIKKGEIALGGFTFTLSDHLFVGQEPVNFDQINDFPPTTAFALSVSLSDQQRYTAHFIKKDTIHVNGYDASINQPTEEIFRPTDHLRAWIGNTISLIYSNDYFRGASSEQMILITSKNADSAKWFLNPFIDPVNDSLGRLYYTSLCSDLWGNTFRLQGNLWCMITKNYVGISSNRSFLERFANSKGMKNKELQQIKDISGQSSNIFIYLKPNLVARWLENKDKGTDKLLVDFLGRNKTIGFQYSADKELQYTHAWMLLNPKRNNPVPEVKRKEVLQENTINNSNQAKEKKSSIIPRETPLQGDSRTDVESYAEIKIKSGSYQPQIVSGNKAGNKQIAVLSKKGNISMFDHTGKLKWSFETPEFIDGKLLEADVQKNGKTNYIAIGKKNLYILDQDGRQVKGSPVKLPGTYAGGGVLFDYDKKRDYRFLYIGDDQLIYNLTLKGVELPDWQKPKVSGTGTIIFHRIAGKDYLIYQYNDEVIKFFDRRGRERIKPDDSFKVSSGTSIFGNETNSKGIFLTVTNKGELVYLNNEGLLSRSTFAKYGTNPWFAYLDFDADGSKDFIFAKNNRIVAYTKLKKVIAENTLKKGNFGIPFIYSASQKDKWIFARNTETDEVIGFNNEGKLYAHKIESETDPIIFNPGGNLKEIIVTSKNGKLILRELDNL